MTNKCIGCGINLQCNNPKELGYYPPTKDKPLYCERCFRLKNYNEYKEVNINNLNNKIISTINKNNYLTFFLLDILNINTETINTFNKITSPKILVISKKDIIPNSIKPNLIIDFLKKIYNIKEDILFISSKKKINTNEIINIINNTKDKKAYITGYTNSGKSTLINTLTTKYKNESNITTSSIPNTTIDFINVKIDNVLIIDTPGFILDNTIYNNKEYDLIKRINPKNFIKPITYQTKDITGILIENRIYLKPGNNNSLTFYLSNNIIIEKVFSDKLTNKETKTIHINNNSDLVIKGLGFINIKKECDLVINSSYNHLIEIRDSLFKKDN